MFKLSSICHTFVIQILLTALCFSTVDASEFKKNQMDLQKSFNKLKLPSASDLSGDDFKDIFNSSEVVKFTESVDKDDIASESGNRKSLAKLKSSENYNYTREANIHAEEIKKEDWVKKAVAKNDLSNKTDDEIIAQTYKDCETIHIPAKHTLMRKTCLEGIDAKTHEFIEDFKVEIEEDPAITKSFDINIGSGNFSQWEAIFESEPSSGQEFIRDLANKGAVNVKQVQLSGSEIQKAALKKVLVYFKTQAVNIIGIQSLNISGSGSYSYDFYEAGFWDFDGDKNKRVLSSVKISVTYKPGTKKVKRKYWTNQRGDIESNVESGRCEYLSMECLRGPETRVIEGISIESKCWQKRYKYICKGNSTDTCTKLRKSGCVYKGMKCVNSIDAGCSLWKKTYDCPGRIITPAKTEVKCSGKGKKPFCLGGSCHNVVDEPNTEFAESIAKLSAFSEMSKDMALTAGNVEIFKGEAKQCARRPFAFVDCCGCSGWGKKAGLSACNDEEKELQQLREKGLCRKVGSRCVRKALGKCMMSKTTYVCFKSKIAVKIHELARDELRIGWGTSKAPITRGLSAEELGSINMNKVDMSGMYDEISFSSNSTKTKRSERDLSASLGKLTSTGSDNNNGIRMEILNGK